MVRDTARPPQTHPQTGPITIHCAAKLSAQYNNNDETRTTTMYKMLKLFNNAVVHFLLANNNCKC